MSDNQGWQTVSHNKTKKVKPDEPVKFDPIPSRQREAQAKIESEKQANKQSGLGTQSNPNQDWNYITLSKSKPQAKPKTFVQKEASSVKTNESGDIVQVKKVSPEMTRAIIDARIAKKWTQIQLANNSAVDVKSISEIERGGCIYNANVFNKLCKALGITIERNCLVEKKTNSA